MSFFTVDKTVLERGESMAKLEQLTVGTIVSGISNTDTVQIIASKWYGDAVLEVTFKDRKGNLASQLLYRDDEVSFWQTIRLLTRSLMHCI